MEAELLAYILVGFAAQLVDGALGMAYGVLSTSFLLSTGLPPAAASASVHTAEVFTTGVSGLSHLYHDNINRRLFLTLVVSGMAGGVLGAYVLTELPAEIIKPFVAGYLAVMGLIILVKAFVTYPKEPPRRGVSPLAVVGGFLDAIGGGGWGPVVVSTLLARGSDPRYTIGSVVAAEFFVTLSVSVTFLLTIGIAHYQVVLGLVLGGILAAPFAGYLSKRLPARWLMVMAALVIVTTSVLTILRP